VLYIVKSLLIILYTKHAVNHLKYWGIAMNRSYSFKIKNPERTWTISLRRFAGKPTIRACRNSKGRHLYYKWYIIGDRLVVLLSGPAQQGTLEIDFEGTRFMYFNYVPWWSKALNWIKGKLFALDVKKNI
jgi:hypothetical protein